MARPRIETANEIADVWVRWLTNGESNRWVKAMRSCAQSGIQFADWGSGLPERKMRIMPFCLEAFAADGRSLGQVLKISELQGLAA